MSTQHHSFAWRAPRGAQAVVRLYPRSVLWLLLTVAVVLAVQGSWVTLAMVLTLTAVVVWNTVRIHRTTRPTGRKGV